MNQSAEGEARRSMDVTPRTIAYLRSAASGFETLKRQKEVITKYSEDRGITVSEFIEEEGISGVSHIQERRIYKLFDKLAPGDILIVTDSSRLSRDTSELTAMLGELRRKGVVLIMTSA